MTFGMYVHLLSPIYCSYDYKEGVCKPDSSLKHEMLCVYTLVVVCDLFTTVLQFV